MKHRAARCEHSFYKGLCPLPECPHWDGRRGYAATNKTVVHEAWGKGRRNLKRREPAAC